MINVLLLQEEFLHRFGVECMAVYFSPGRVNLIGEHIDYNGGFVLPVTISLGISAVVSERKDTIVRIFAKEYNQECSIDLKSMSPNDIDTSAIKWQDYIIATLLVLRDKNVNLSGADILLSSDLPMGSGLSSSAALECLIAYIFHKEYYQQHRKELALDAQIAERNYVGVNCGIMDQFAVANGKQHHALLLNCATLEFNYIPVDFKNYHLVIINSNKSRALADSKYNERRTESDAAFKQLQQFDIAEDLCHVHEISLGYLDDDILYKRAKHAVLENKRVLLAVEALKAGQLEAFGSLLTQSHQSLDADFEVSGFELNMIVHYSTHFDSCIGARMTGAGFGGCCIALVEKNNIDRFKNFVGKKYTEKTGLKADFYIAEISESVHQVVL